MNERIKELAEQSIAEYWPQPYNDRQRILENFSDFMEIFAKLIIQECARCVTQPTIQAAGQTEIAIRALQDVLANDMKAYFGVKDV